MPVCAAGLHRAVHSTFDCRSRCRKFEFQFSYITCGETDREIIATVILSFPLIQESQLSIIGKSTVKLLRGISLPRKSANMFYMILLVLSGLQIKSNQKLVCIFVPCLFKEKRGEMVLAFRGSWRVVRISPTSDSMYIMSVTPPTVVCLSFWNCTDVLSWS